MSVHYHPGKANVVVDTLSRLSMGSVAHIEVESKDLVKDVYIAFSMFTFLLTCSLY